MIIGVQLDMSFIGRVGECRTIRQYVSRATVMACGLRGTGRISLQGWAMPCIASNAEPNATGGYNKSPSNFSGSAQLRSCGYCTFHLLSAVACEHLWKLKTVPSLHSCRMNACLPEIAGRHKTHSCYAIVTPHETSRKPPGLFTCWFEAVQVW
jgi:hypothetical protein